MKNNFRIVLTINNVSYDYSSESVKTIKIQQSLGNDISKPSYGITSQTAIIHLIDKDKTIYYTLNNNLNTVVYIDIYLNDVLNAHYISDNLDYNFSDSTTTITLRDDAITLQKFKTNSYALGGIKKIYNEETEQVETSGELYPLSSLVDILFEDTKSVIGDKYVLDVDDYTQYILDNIKLSYGYLMIDTYWNNWNKVCNVGLLKIYLSDNKFVIRRYV